MRLEIHDYCLLCLDTYNVRKAHVKPKIYKFH